MVVGRLTATFILMGAAPAHGYQVKLSWSPVAAADGYSISVRQGDVPYEAWIDVGAHEPDSDGIIRHVLSGISPGVRTYFTVASYNSGGESPPSNELSVLVPSELCPPTPVVGCDSASWSMFSMSIAGRPRLSWRWRGSFPTSSFGDPKSTTNYALCVYDAAAGSARLVFSARTPAGGTCGRRRPCWQPARGYGFTYINPVAAPDGVLKTSVKEKRAGTTHIAVKGQGPNLPVPIRVDGKLFREGATVTVQLRNDAEPAGCWSAAWGPDAQVSRFGRFKALAK